MRTLLVIIFLHLFNYLQAQQSDFIILKKKNVVLKNIFAGQNIAFTSKQGLYREGYISAIKNDSITIQVFLVRRMLTTFGSYVLDTAGSVKYLHHYNDIAAMGKPKKNFNLSGSGNALVGGGILLVVASGITYVADRKRFSGGLLGAAAGLALAGYFIGKSANKPLVIGKQNVTLQYMNMQKK